MTIIPELLRPLVQPMADAFTRPTFKRFLTLIAAAVLSTGRRTVSNLLRTAGGLATGHPSSYHSVFSRRRWSTWTLARALSGTTLRRFAPDEPVPLAGDDTVEEHRGEKVYGKGRHRDPVRSTHSYTAWRRGHKWVVLAVLVKFPFASRPWALPVLVALYRTPEWDHERRRRHKTPCELMRQLLAVLIHWSPGRRFIFAGDGGYGTHALARFAHRHRRRLTLVSRFYADAQLYEPAPEVVGKRPAHRPRKKGEKLPTPQEVVATTGRTALEVSWYGGGRRDIEVVADSGHWLKSGKGLVPVRWAFVHDVTGTHRDDYFFSTDVDMAPKSIVETFTGRWSIETTFQEMRPYLGLETTRGWTETTVLRVVPCLFGLYSMVTLVYERLHSRGRSTTRVDWVGKVETTFSDAITTVRRWLWSDWVFAHHSQGQALSKLPRALRDTLFSALAPAA
jgi:DDE superfamily endonuclease